MKKYTEHIDYTQLRLSLDKIDSTLADVIRLYGADAVLDILYRIEEECYGHVVYYKEKMRSDLAKYWEAIAEILESTHEELEKL